MRRTPLLVSCLLLVMVVLPVPPVAHGDDEDPAAKARQIAHLRMLVREGLDKLDADPNVHALKSLGRLRDELDRRRDRALVALFHPVDAAKVRTTSPAGRHLQRIVDRRLTAVRELWNDARTVTISQQSHTPHTLRLLGRLLEDLERHGDPAPKLRAAAANLPLYWYVQEVGIRDWFRTKAESDLHHYDRWVMATYNAARREQAAATTGALVTLVNEHRRMIGFGAVVKPAVTITPSMDEAAILRALDAATITRRMPLRMLRIDARLDAAALGHAKAMAKGGFFSHNTPAHVQVTTGRTPHDRARSAGYKGSAVMEILALASDDPKAANLVWRRSLPQHRILLGAGSDIGVGRAERFWTLLIARGDGGPQRVQPDLTPRRGDD